MELGESVSGCAIREVHEETGLHVEPVAIVGIYSDPKHVFVDDELHAHGLTRDKVAGWRP